MPRVTFHVLDGIDKGRLFRELTTPVTIGREEGNILRLNDERVSRYHAKVQCDNSEFILTDLESTNGTRVNGTVVQIRRLKPGDRVQVGRSTLLFGSEDEIHARMATLGQSSAAADNGLVAAPGSVTIPAHSLGELQLDNEYDFQIGPRDPVAFSPAGVTVGKHTLPPLPAKMSPSQAARLAELFEFLHRQLTLATENVQCNDDATQVTLTYTDWQRVLGGQMLLARYNRAVAEPDVLDE